MFINFTQAESNKIIEHFGQRFYDKVLEDIKIYSEKWKLQILQLVDYYSVNCIFKCYSELLGDVILKIGNPCKEVFTEYNALCEYNGNRFCNVYDSDIDNGIILEEQIIPGTRLRDEKSFEKRLFIFTKLFNGLHIKPLNAKIYPTYFEWVSRITEYMSNRDDYKDLYSQMKKAKNICSLLSETYSKKMLLHGDLHHDNILLVSGGEYKIIDPKGVIGDPVFDIPRFILNEIDDDNNMTYDYYKKHVLKVIDYFEKSLNIPSEVIKKCLYIETVMANCWCVEDNEEPDMDSVTFAEAVMENQQLQRNNF